MSSLVETVLFVFGLVALGYLSGLTGYLKASYGEALSAFAVSVALPILLFRTMMQADFAGAAPWLLWSAYFSAIAVTWAVGQWITVRVFGRDSKAGVVGGVSAAFSNLVILGIPFMLGVYGQQGFEILSLLIAVHLPAMMAASIVLFAIVGRDRSQAVHPLGLVSDFARKIATNPLIIAILAGVAWRLTGLEIPTLGMRFVDALAQVAGPLALFAMGLGLVGFGISGNLMPAIVLSGLKLVFMPAVALGFALLLGLPPMTAKVAVAAAALPSGVNSYLIATQFGTGQALSSNAMTVATLSAVVTAAFWLSVTEAVFG